MKIDNSQKEASKTLTELRQSIDNLDAALIFILAERFTRTDKVGHLKAKLHLSAVDHDRELEQFNRIKQLAEDADLDPIFVEKVFKLIISEVIQNHENIAKGMNV
nr:chorismate mutase [Acinetobacter sp. Marseille-Q1620]